MWTVDLFVKWYPGSRQWNCIYAFELTAYVFASANFNQAKKVILRDSHEEKKDKSMEHSMREYAIFVT